MATRTARYSPAAFTGFLLAAWLICPLSLLRAEEAIPVPYIAGLTTDGNLESAWEKVTPLAINLSPINAEAIDRLWIPRYPTQARLAWSDEGLHLLFVCGGPRPVSTFTRRDDHLYKEDVVEVFLDVEEYQQRYYEFLASPMGILFDSVHQWKQPPTFPADRIDWKQIEYHATDAAWNLKGLQVAATRRNNDTGMEWTVEMTIPLKELAVPPTTRPSAAREIRLNLLRYAYQGKEDQRTLVQMNLSPVMKGCPHVSPMAMMRFRLEPNSYKQHELHKH